MQHEIYAGGKGYLCELEQRLNVRDDDEDMKLMNGFIGPLENEIQWKNLMDETTKEVVMPHDFKANDWFVFAGCRKSEDDRQSLKTVVQLKR